MSLRYPIDTQSRIRSAATDSRWVAPSEARGNVTRRETQSSEDNPPDGAGPRPVQKKYRVFLGSAARPSDHPYIYMCA